MYAQNSAAVALPPGRRRNHVIIRTGRETLPLEGTMSFEIVEEEEGLLFRITGDVTPNGMMDATVRGWQHPAWDTIRYQIWDFTGIGRVLIDNASAIAFANMEKTSHERAKSMRIASVVADAKMKKVCERFCGQARSNKIDARTFSNEDEARRWLAA